MGDGFFSFALVSGAHIENVLAHRLVQYHGAGRRGHLGDVAFLKQGGSCPMCETFPASGTRRLYYFLQSVCALFLAPASAQTCHQGRSVQSFVHVCRPGIDGIQIELGTVRGFLDTCAYGTGESGGLSDQDLGLHSVTQGRQRKIHRIADSIVLCAPANTGSLGCPLAFECLYRLKCNIGLLTSSRRICMALKGHSRGESSP